jgi:MSHA biogenesis protein MshK
MMWRLTLEVKTFSTVLLVVSLAFVGIFSLMEFASAEALRDPTQLPSSMVAADSANADGSQTTTKTGPVLQSVMLGAQYRAAIINGKKVKLGAKYENATLVALTENSATLKNSDGSSQTLVMSLGDIKKTPVIVTYQPPKTKNVAQTAPQEKLDTSVLISSDSNPIPGSK